MALSSDPKKRAKQLANRRNAPPAPKGSKRALTHGGTATPEPRRQAKLEAQIAAALPVRDHDGGPPVHDMVMVRLLAITLVRLESVVRYVSKHGQLTRAGRVTPAVELEDKLTARAQKLAADLGMTPTSRAKLGLDLARTQVDLATLMSEAGDKPPRTRPRPDDIDAGHTIEGTATDA